MSKLSKKNVILLTADSLRGDHLSCYGYHRKTSPNIDKLAERGTVFTQCISNSGWTLPSFVSLFTSTYPLSYGGYRYLSEDRKLVAEVLKENKYKTAAYTSNPFLSAKRELDRGFDIFEEFEGEMPRISVLRMTVEPYLRKVFSLVRPLYAILAILSNSIGYQASTKEYLRADEVNQRAISWLEQNLDGNFFLWLHYMDTHYRYNPPADCLRKFRSESVTNMQKSRVFFKMRFRPQFISNRELEILHDLYDGEVRYWDQCIGSLINRLSDLGVLEDTIIFVTADHGEEFQEHGNFAHFDETLYDESIRVPLIIAGPGIERGIVDEQVSLIDVAPTIVDLLKLPEVGNFQGRSLLSAIRLAEERRNVISENSKKIAIRSEHWKYIYDRESATEELYNLHVDPQEQNNLSQTEHEVINEFRSELNAHLSMIERTAIHLPDVELEKEVKERLRRLGYFQ